MTIRWPDRFLEEGLVVAFAPTSPVQAQTFNANSVQLLLGQHQGGDIYSFTLFVQVDCLLGGFEMHGACATTLITAIPAPGGDVTTGPVTALRIRPGEPGSDRG